MNLNLVCILCTYTDINVHGVCLSFMFKPSVIFFSHVGLITACSDPVPPCNS